MALVPRGRIRQLRRSNQRGQIQRPGFRQQAGVAARLEQQAIRAPQRPTVSASPSVGAQAPQPAPTVGATPAGPASGRRVTLGREALEPVASSVRRPRRVETPPQVDLAAYAAGTALRQQGAQAAGFGAAAARDIGEQLGQAAGQAGRAAAEGARRAYNFAAPRTAAVLQQAKQSLADVTRAIRTQVSGELAAASNARLARGRLIREQSGRIEAVRRGASAEINRRMAENAASWQRAYDARPRRGRVTEVIPAARPAPTQQAGLVRQRPNVIDVEAAVRPLNAFVRNGSSRLRTGPLRPNGEPIITRAPDRPLELPAPEPGRRTVRRDRLEREAEAAGTTLTRRFGDRPANIRNGTPRNVRVEGTGVARRRSTAIERRQFMSRIGAAVRNIEDSLARRDVIRTNVQRRRRARVSLNAQRQREAGPQGPEIVLPSVAARELQNVIDRLRPTGNLPSQRAAARYQRYRDISRSFAQRGLNARRNARRQQRETLARVPAYLAYIRAVQAQRGA